MEIAQQRLLVLREQILDGEPARRLDDHERSRAGEAAGAVLDRGSWLVVEAAEACRLPADAVVVTEDRTEIVVQGVERLRVGCFFEAAEGACQCASRRCVSAAGGGGTVGLGSVPGFPALECLRLERLRLRICGEVVLAEEFVADDQGV
ncbi:hypothetical protein [Tsukamurella asaccharolytica]|uniref:hypothetical protein n=1 Tax=Tsukamurella asaccharolytica TaxID=2592067 RepID=UPI001E2ABBD0|nr:hypothetical protein [Tsukamurella asaccharolytica]